MTQYPMEQRQQKIGMLDDDNDDDDELFLWYG